ncbi:MAG: hypothetical protein JXB85_10200 [Anaerolineales bacterium]|nr:hypothetical protein [Anaerolineales bacterium]
MDQSLLADTQVIRFQDWTLRLRLADSTPARLLLLLHGWTGDENSMWIFVRDFPTEITLLAPRAPSAAPEGGYSWRAITPQNWGLPALDDLRPAVASLLTLVDDWGAQTGLDVGQFDVLGFSQGASLVYTLAALHPGRIRRLGALSGFLPQGLDDLLAGGRLDGKPAYVAHGTQDDLIPVARGRQAARALEAAGARVTYCEAETGHKVSADCLRGIRQFFTQN